MSTRPEALEPAPSNHPPADSVPDSLSELQTFFDRWWDQLHSTPRVEPEPASIDDQGSEIFMESLPGSNCEVTFEGVLHFDGHSIGNIRSPGGALVVTKRGIVDADIEVSVAVISGTVNGNITATERVMLDSDARVKGQIITPLLSVKPGAAFEGDCVFVGSEESELLDHAPMNEEFAEISHQVVEV